MNKALTDEKTKENPRLKRLQFRSWHRGWKETDLILGSFADAMLAHLTPAQLTSYEQLLDEDDDIIWGWIIGKTETPAEFSEIIGMLEGYGRTA